MGTTPDSFQITLDFWCRRQNVGPAAPDVGPKSLKPAQPLMKLALKNKKTLILRKYILPARNHIGANFWDRRKKSTVANFIARSAYQKVLKSNFRITSSKGKKNQPHRYHDHLQLRPILRPEGEFAIPDGNQKFSR